jgi:hypothetical protein
MQPNVVRFDSHSHSYHLFSTMISHSLVAALVLGGLVSSAQSPRRRHHELAKKQEREQTQDDFGYMSVGYYVRHSRPPRRSGRKDLKWIKERD